MNPNLVIPPGTTHRAMSRGSPTADSRATVSTRLNMPKT